MDHDDPDPFAEEMARLGVTPLSNRARVRREPLASRPDRPPTAPEAPPAAVDAAAPAPVVPSPDSSEIEALRRRAEEAERALAGERAAWQRERARSDDRDRQLRHALSLARKAVERHAPLADLLRARGCADREEAVAVLQGLLERRPDEMLDAVTLSEPEAVARILDERVAFVGRDVDVDLGPECVVVRVSPDRCEITGGSDLQAAFRRCLDACRRAGVRRVTIVGGSPVYRRQLRALAAPHEKELALNLVSGTQRRERKRAEADKRTSDLVIVWGATELDHSVSAVYTEGPGQVVTVPHRGISRMLGQVAEHLTARSG